MEHKEKTHSPSKRRVAEMGGTSRSSLIISNVSGGSGCNISPLHRLGSLFSECGQKIKKASHKLVKIKVSETSVTSYDRNMSSHQSIVLQMDNKTTIAYANKWIQAVIHGGPEFMCLVSRKEHTLKSSICSSKIAPYPAKLSLATVVFTHSS
ncbi:hypothetical protein GDO81_014079 [Engystomops pustulosus]|uniref:Uncharacterized protein n=1 Tax=Engystomops pustulosus TaxID=76066 RepID=A0AAV7B7Y5_ENGPU|nr:hypothetical protein GDO81_014079 [Engystomops pustulosus]